MGVTVREKDKGSGIYWIFINHNGKRKSKQVGDKKAAQQIAKQIEAKLLTGQLCLAAPQEKTFADYAKLYFAHAMVKPSTRNEYERDYKLHIKKAFGDQPISGITRMAVKNLLRKKLQAGYSVSSISNIKAVISEVFNTALDDAAIQFNPAKNLGKIEGKRTQRATEQKVKIRFLSRAQLSLLLETFARHDPAHYPLAMLLARTGLRIGEAVALQWGDISFTDRVIHVRRSWTNRRMDTPKSGKGRMVDMSLQLAAVLYGLKARRDKTAAHDFLFPSSVNKGMPINAIAWRIRRLLPMLAKAGLPPIRVHDMRHTYASLLIAAGESLVYIRDQLGHSSIQVTADYYGHLAPGSNKAAVDNLDDTAVAGCV